MNTTLKELEKGLFAKLDFENPTGSAKYRPALFMFNDALKKGQIKEGGTVIEATSGNTGIALSYVAKENHCKAVIIMPENMSRERIEMIKSYGGEVVLTPAAKGMAGSVEKAKEILNSTPNSFIASQFTNPSNVLSHYMTTGPEILNQMKGNIDYFVAGIGTGGTISGVGKFLKEKNPNIKIVGVEPQSSPLLTKGTVGPHKIQGIGANFIPQILDKSVIDTVVDVSNEDAYSNTRELAFKYGVFCGISSGAAFSCAKNISKENKGKNVVVFFPDSADRYYSTGIFEGLNGK